MCAAVKTYRIGKFDLNPRGNLWAKDESKFGQKLLSKMGWSEGKGLGKNENGVTESIKVRMKIGHSGVGWSEKLSIGVESEEYDAVLESLNKRFNKSDETKTENNLKGLEQRSQQFKNRLHYQKFLRGKDVCQYSEKDMNSIFVTRKCNLDLEPVSVKSTVTNVDSNPTENSAPESIPTFKSQLSMTDYFAMKLKRKSEEQSEVSLMCTEDAQYIEESPPENEICNRKRKRELKNNSKKLKKVKLEQPEDYDEVNMLPLPNISNGVKTEELSDGEIPSVKKEKKNKKLKLGKLENLKSCLKKSFGSVNYWFNQDKKEVSFNDSVSYKVIENVLDEIDAETDFEYAETSGHNAMDCFEEDQHTVEELNGSQISNYVEDNFKDVDLNDCVNGYSEEFVQDEAEVQQPNNVSETPKCFDLPKCDNSNYNTWLESQRIAIKMKQYKNMVKKIRKHSVLRTSNLLDIKGYGNWGF